jgi:uncharacterized protein (TIGR03000 family)
MRRHGLRGTGTTLLLAGALLGATGPAAAQSCGWLGRIQIGPPRTPEEYARQEDEYLRRVNQPDTGPAPPSSWYWPSLREALDRYGWLGRRTGHNGHGDFPAGPLPAVPEGPMLPPPAPPGTGPSDPAPAVIRVHLPADAVLWFEDRPTTTTGPVRLFVSPPLAAGQEYSYELRVTWSAGGKEIRRTQRVRIRAGDRATVDFTAG